MEKKRIITVDFIFDLNDWNDHEDVSDELMIEDSVGLERSGVGWKLSEKDKEINALKEQLTPIPVSERLPEPGEKVLVYGEFGSQMCYRGYFYGKIEWLYHINSSKVPYEITHWLPIPSLNQ